MWLMVYILHEDRYLTEVLEEMVEIGVCGASIIDSVGMLHYMSEEIPIFAGFRSLLKETKPFNKVILSVIPDREILEKTLDAIDRAVGGIARGDRGVLFSVKLEHLLGPESPPSSL